MFEGFIGRENAVLDILQRFTDSELDFVVIGGFAVAAFKHRFSVDADVVVKKEDIRTFEGILRASGFRKEIHRALEDIYSSEFVRYKKEDALPVHVDLMVGGVAVRQTGASFGFDLLRSHSKRRKIIGSEKEITAAVPDKETLIALKLHAGRLTDFRDAAALCENVNIDSIKDLTRRGNTAILKQHAEKLKNLISEMAFVDSFKGVFAESTYGVDIACIKKVCAAILSI